jgi:hypothetical protein
LKLTLARGAATGRAESICNSSSQFQVVRGFCELPCETVNWPSSFDPAEPVTYELLAGFSVRWRCFCCLKSGLSMPVLSRIPGLKNNRPSRCHRATRLGHWWHRAPLRLDAFEDRTVPSATVTTNEWATQLPESPLAITGTVRRELVIVDPHVANYQSLVRDLLSQQSAFRRFDVAVLRADEDGLDQIMQLLGNERGLSAIHFISHGNSGGMQLGATWLDTDTLAARQGQVASWAKALKPGADLLFYECDLAGGPQGRALLESIRALTGADVAASTDRTGAASLGGNWQLEFHEGSIETAIAPSWNFQRTYTGSLATFVVTNNSSNGAGSLRFAINSANKSAGLDTITFNLAGVGVQTIKLFGALPTITDPVVIDGTTQPGFSGTPLIELDGSGVGPGANGLEITGGGSTIRGLITNQFSNDGILLSGPGNNVIVGNYIGTDSAGSTGLANGNAGIQIQSSNNTIGGTAVADRNVISGNTVYGIQISGGTSNNVVLGNYIGLNSAGTSAIANAVGVYVDDPNNTIGGTTAGARNVISGNTGAGVELDSASAAGNTVEGNYIGWNAAGTAIIANGSHGILINAASGNLIGGTTAGAGNVITGNLGAGVAVLTGTGNQILDNSIFANAGLGIDLNNDGVTPNDGATNPLQANNGIDYAILTSVNLTGNMLTVTGTAGTPFATIQIYLAADDGNNNGPIFVGDGLNVPHGEGSVLLGTITADAAGNFNQTITVSGINLADAITALVTDGAGNTSEFSPNQNCVTPKIIVSPLSLTTSESGTTANFAVVLASAPIAPVTITLTNGNPSEGILSTSILVFDASNWNMAQIVTVTGVDDFIVNGPITYTITLNPATSLDPGYNGINPADVTVTNTENDTAGFIVTPTSGLTTTEAGGQATFTVRLTSQPTAPVTISVSSSNTAEGTVNVSSLTFDASNWNTPQTVTITGVDDHIVNGDQTCTIILGAASSPDPIYSGMNPGDVSVTNKEADVAGFIVTPTSGLITTEAGGQATFTVQLTSQPTAPVTIGVTSGNSGQGTVNVSSLTFDAGNWNTPQTVTITGADDHIVNGDQTYTIILAAASSADPIYSGMNPGNVSVTNKEADVAGFIVTPTGGLITTEAGGQATFTVQLTSQPTAPVTIGVTSGNSGQGTVNVSSLTFDASNWNSPQTVTITGVDDHIVNGDQLFSIILGAASSPDLIYGGMNPGNVSVTNKEADVAGILVTSVGNLIVDNNGTTATVMVSLTSQPVGPVDIQITPANPNDIASTPVIVTFTGPDWATGILVTLRSVNSNRPAGDTSVPITFTAASSDGVYAGKTAGVVAVSRIYSASGTSSKTDSPLHTPPTPPPIVFSPPDPTQGISDPSSITQDSGSAQSGSGAKQLADGGGGGAELEGAANAAASGQPKVEVATADAKLADKAPLVPTAEVITPYKPLVVPAHGYSVTSLQLPDKVGNEITEEKTVRASSARLALGTVVIASAGCVLWSLRGAAWLLSAAATAAPAWTVLDPMALLMARQRRHREKDDETLAELANTANRR